MEPQRRLAVKHDPRIALKAGRADSFRAGDSASDMTELNVLFRRDERGNYGLTVSGDNPVFVQNVTENGPAAISGLKRGDRIIRVNGHFVTKSNHHQVVDFIKQQVTVAMTIIRTDTPFLADTNSIQSHVANPGYDRSEGNLKDSSVDALSKRYAQEMRYVEELRRLIEASSEEHERQRIRNDLDRAVKHIGVLEKQMNSMGKHVPPYSFTAIDESNNGQKLTQPPTPPPITSIPKCSIPRHQDDISVRNSLSPSSNSGLNRRRSNPEAMHLGVNRMTLTAGQANSGDQSALNRSSSAVSVGKLECNNSVADEMPPPLPVKRRSDAAARLRSNTSLHDFPVDSTDLSAPSGTPPPPYGAGRVPKSGSFNGLSNNGPRVASIRQMDVMTAEESIFHINQGPFMEYFALQRSLPHLAVFMNYLITNNHFDTVTALLFHLITDVYPKGNSKELLRWAFEIHSTFIVPGSPLDLLSCVSCEQSHTSIISAIDEVLAKPDREEQLRMVFSMARSFALEAIKHRLVEFQDRRAQGLGTLFGPTDIELEEAVHSPEKAREIVDRLLSCQLEAITYDSSEEPENRSDSRAALGCALATFLKLNGVKAVGRDNVYLVDKWPLFVQKDKSKFRLKDKSKKSVKSGHQFSPVSFNSLFSCLHCHTILWGVGPQGYQCTSCDYTAHRGCVKNVEELCVGDKKERRSFISMDSFGIFGRKRSNNSPTAITNAKKGHDEKEGSDVIVDTPAEPREEPRGYVNQVVNRIETGKMAQETATEAPPVLTEKTSTKVPPLTVVGRSESLKAQKKTQVKPGVRKKSDPAHFHPRDDDVDDAGPPADHNGHGLAVSGSSSVSLQSLPSDGSLVFEDDPDFEADPDHIPSWQTMLTDPSVVESLDNRAKKRQEVLAELFHTEQTHVAKLKMLYKVFFLPISREQLLSADVIHQVFANLEEMIKMHIELNEQMKDIKASGTLIGNVGDVLMSRFAGDAGTSFKMAAAAFNRNQTSGLEALKNSQVKNPKLVRFLEEASGNPLCRRLMLKDIIPTGMQRLTKYPLLLENLVKYTANETDEEQAEMKKIQMALVASKEILDFVNHAIHESANYNRLRELQTRIDMTPFVKSQHKLALEHKNIDLSKYCLLFDGDLTWRLSKQKTVDLHVILLNKMLLLVTKQDDKLLLKFHASIMTTGDSKKPAGDGPSKSWPPVLSLDGLRVCDVAYDKNAFFVIQPSSSGFSVDPRMYELVANTDKEQKQWKKYILEAIDRVSHEYESIKETFPSSATVSVTAPLPIISTESDAPDSGHVQSDEDDFLDDSNDDIQQIDRLTLTSPSDVVVTEPFVEDAKVIISTMEQLRRHDDKVEECLVDKQRLVSHILGISSIDAANDEIELSAESPDGKAVIRHLMNQANSLTRLVKDTLTISAEEPEELILHHIDPAPLETDISGGVSVSVQTMPALQPGVPIEDLQPVVTNLNRGLSSLLRYLCEKDMENEHLRSQLALVRQELVHVRAEARSRSPTPISTRPDSRTSFHGELSEPALTIAVSSPNIIPVTPDVVPPDESSTNDNLQEEEILHL